MKKLIIATGTLGGGGAERAFLNIANEMIKRDVEVHVLVTGSRPAVAYEMDDRIIVDTIASGKKAKIFKIFDKFFQFRSYFKKHKGSTVISFFPDVSAYCTIASLGILVKNVVSERNDPNTIPRKRYMKMIRNLAFRLADVCVFQTEDAKAYFPKKVQKKGVVISNPIAVEKLPVSKPLSEREKIVILVGRIVPQKNFKMMLDAWAVLKDEFPSYEVHIYGDKTYRDGIFTAELEQIIEEKSLDGVKLMGFSTEVYAKMNEATVYVSTSDFEGMSNTMLEAMAIGTPTIATDCPIGGARTIIRHRENGILIPVGDVNALVTELRALLQDEEAWKHLSAGGVQLREGLNVQAICTRWYEQL